MHPIRPVRPSSLGVRLLVLVLLSLVSVVVARALIGIEVRDGGVPVAKGDVVDGTVDVYVVPFVPDDAELRLSFDDGTREDGFARQVGGELVITTIDAGTEPLIDYLRRQGIVGYQVPIESSCELMAPDHALFGALCSAYARNRMPATHPEIDGLPCSTCHDTVELEASYERARPLVPSSATPPPGHRDVGNVPCATCHAGFAAAGDAGAVAPPPGHRAIGSQACSSCHGSAGDGGTAVVLPPGHRAIGSQACSTCHWPPGDPDAGSVRVPREHRAIGDLKCVACHGSGGDDHDDYDDDYDDDDHDDDHDDDDD